MRHPATSSHKLVKRLLAVLLVVLFHFSALGMNAMVCGRRNIHDAIDCTYPVHVVLHQYYDAGPAMEERLLPQRSHDKPQQQCCRTSDVRTPNHPIDWRQQS